MTFRIETLRVPPAADYVACEGLIDDGIWGAVCVAQRITFDDGRRAVVVTQEGCSRYGLTPADCYRGAGESLWEALAARVGPVGPQPAVCPDPDAREPMPFFGVLLFACLSVGALAAVSIILTTLFAMIARGVS